MVKDHKADETAQIIQDPKFLDFLTSLEITGQIRDKTKLTPEEERDAINKFAIWKSKGMPAPQMPDLTTEEDSIQKLYRVKYLGKQYIYYIKPDGSEVGREYIAIFKKTPEIIDGKPTGKMIDSDVLDKFSERFTIDYTKDIGEKLVSQAFRTVPHPTFYMRQGMNKILVNNPEEEFNADFDKIMKIALKPT